MILLLCLSPAATGLDSQRPLSQALLRIWQVQQGLPRASIFSTLQTSDGYLWLGTQIGLYRFDGVRFVAAHERLGQSLAELWIQDLCEDHDHNLWIATDAAGLFRVQGEKVTSFGIAEGLPSLHVECLIVDRRGELWAGTDQGLAHFCNDKLVIYRTEQGLPHNNIRALGEANDGTIVVGTQGPNLCTWNGSKFDVIRIESLPPNTTINALQYGADDALWIGTTAGLICQQRGGERHFTTTDGLGNDLVYCLAPSSSGGMFVGTKDGLCRIQDDRIERLQTKDGLSQSTVLTLCEDHEGSLWVGTKHGLNQLVDRRTLLPFTTTEGLPSNDTGPILQDQAGNIWVGTLGAGLAHFEDRQFSITATTQNGLPSDTILSLADGGETGLWIGTDKGLCRFSNGQIVDMYTTSEGLPSEEILSICRDPQGVVWVGTSAGLVYFHDGRFFAPEGDTLTVRRSVQALVSHPGKYLIASMSGGGLYQLNNGQLSALENQTQLSRDIDAMYLDQDNRLWTAIRGIGLGMNDGENHFQFSVKDGLFDDDIYGIAGDDKGHLWMACSRGIFSVTLDDLQKFVAGEIKQVMSTPFSPTDGQRTIECRSGVQPAVWKVHDGKVWFSTIRGVIVIDPQKVNRTLPRPNIVIEEVHVNGQDVYPQDVGRLPPGRTNLDFRYTALSFASPSRITFRYKLDGFDKEWVDAGSRREAFYTNLSPGNYRFRVQAINSDGTDSESAQPVDIRLDPLFYQTRWFIPLAVAAIAGISWLAYRFRIRQIKSRMRAVLAERSRIARELHDTLIQGFSGVTMQMQALTARLPTSPERNTLAEIIHDAGGCLSEARRSVAGLRNPQSDESGLAAAIAEAARQLTETVDTKLQLHLAPLQRRFNPDVEYNILRIVQEAISNAIKHSGANHIVVTMNAKSQFVVISVSDDGSGFDLNQHLVHVESGHYGLIGMRERAVQIGAEVKWRSEPKQGTTVTISLGSTPVVKSIA